MLYRALAAALLMGSAATLAAQSSVSFELASDPNFVGGGAGGAVVAGDFNNDGKPDVMQCCGTNDLVFREGNGDGTFQPPATAVAAAGSTQALAAADFNGDGKLDLAGLSGASGTLQLYVWYGNGDGTFQTPLTYATSDGPESVAAGRFFGDGHPDIAVGEANGTIDLFQNEGTAFVLAKSISLGGGSFAQVQLDAGDLNGNGIADLAAAVVNGSNPGTTYVLWNDGKGNLSPVTLGTYVQPVVRVSRLNGDGMLDILVGYTCNPQANTGPGKGPGYNACAGFDVYYGQGNNHLFKRTVVTDSGVYGPDADVELYGVDVNGDGYGDIVAASGTSCFCSFGLFVWQGNADGSFEQTPQEFIVSTDSAGPVAAGDFNRDGMMDFAMDLTSAGNGEFLINATPRAACGTYTIDPTVTVCQPVDGTYSPSPVRVQATSYDTAPVTAMQEYIDYQLMYSQPVTHFDTTFSAGLGQHLFVTKAWDSSGGSFVADRTMTVYDGTPGPVCPAAPGGASICLPYGTSSGAPVRILANGSSGSNVPTAAQLYINGNLVVNDQGYCYQNGNCAGGTSYIDTTQNLSSGTYDLAFKLWDAGGNVEQAEQTITVH